MLDGLDLAGYTVLADKGFAGEEFEQFMAGLDANFMRPDRKGKHPASERSAHCANGSNRSSGPAKANSPSNATADAPTKASQPASHSDSSPSPPHSGTTNKSGNQDATSRPTPTDTESTI
jgi:hypothetical protein